jgi:glycolate oxidase FAD binding subunit
MTTSSAREGLKDALRGLLDASSFSGSLSDYAIDGVEPTLVCAPRSQEEAAAVLRQASEVSAAVVPWGGGSQQRLGMRPARYDVAMDLKRLNRVIEYEPADLTVTCEAGIPLQELQRLLGERGQWLPLDPPLPGEATVGGVLATNASGPARTAHGSARDLVIGMTAGLADGSLVKSGGRVVKNVAGYDMAKLHIGALGTLGVILQVSFKVAPLPPLTRTLTVAAASPGPLFRLANAVYEVGLATNGLAVVWAERVWNLRVRFAGSQAAVDRSERDLRLLGRRLSVEEAGQEVWHALVELNRAAFGEAEVVVRTSALPVHVQETAELTVRARPEVVVVYPSVGVGYARWRQAPSSTALSGLRQSCESRGGALVLEAAPADLKRSVGVWGEPRGDFGLMQRLKNEFDPRAVLNPGRYLGGL